MVAISLTTKLNLCLVRIRLVAFLPLTEYSRLRHSFSIATFYLHVTWHVTKLSFVYSCWASLCAQGNSDWWSADLPRGRFFTFSKIVNFLKNPGLLKKGLNKINFIHHDKIVHTKKLLSHLRQRFVSTTFIPEVWIYQKLWIF